MMKESGQESFGGKMDKTGVVCVGMTVLDILVRPVDRDIQNRDITKVDEIGYAAGGDAINEATTLARLDIPVQLMSSVGNDMWGDYIIQTGKESGIDMTHVIRCPDLPTTVSIVLIRGDGERNFVCSKKGTGFYFMTECLDMDSISSAQVVSLASLYTAPEMDAGMLQAARAALHPRVSRCCGPPFRPPQYHFTGYADRYFLGRFGAYPQANGGVHCA
jgi:sugar/nucleoside kinase (ribokinase family)